MNPPDARAGPADDRALRAFDRSLPMALLRAREAVMSRFRPILAEHGVTEQQWRVLRALSSAADPLSVGDLSEQTFLLGPSLSRMLASLEERSLIERGSAADDARRAVIRIAPAGRDLVATIGPESEATYRHIADALGDDALDSLYDLLERTAATA
ncbi:MAG: homoprotocatechuate degradation operon regulator HpaR [Actinomycetota bacterium]